MKASIQQSDSWRKPCECACVCACACVLFSFYLHYLFCLPTDIASFFVSFPLYIFPFPFFLFLSSLLFAFVLLPWLFFCTFLIFFHSFKLLYFLLSCLPPAVTLPLFPPLLWRVTEHRVSSYWIGCLTLRPSTPMSRPLLGLLGNDNKIEISCYLSAHYPAINTQDTVFTAEVTREESGLRCRERQNTQWRKSETDREASGRGDS